MVRKVLENKPLVEAIFELRWKLQEPTPGVKIDPHYKILIGRAYDRVQDKYPFHEQLPTATMPDEIAGYVVQHRFRKAEDEWPLIQIGPGIITLNDTEGYIWGTFREGVSQVLETLFEAYPEAEKNLKIQGLLLRYIDAIDFDYENDDIFTFLKDKMKMNLELHEQLFDGTGVSKKPRGFDLRLSFPSTNPEGAIHLRFARGKRKDENALIWETQVQSIGDATPTSKDEINTWIDSAHKLTDDWFFKIIEGELKGRFE
jgi:uncharacterized protein (TIGR04255 family)